MEYSRKQKQLDVKKWVDSEIKGYDACGSYDYCANCNKDIKHPCAHAYETYSAIANLTKTTKTTKTIVRIAHVGINNILFIFPPIQTTF